MGEDRLELLEEEQDQSSFAEIAVMAGYPKAVDGAGNTLDLLALFDDKPGIDQ